MTASKSTESKVAEINELFSHVFALSLSVLLTQIWGSFMVLQMQETANRMGVPQPEKSFKTLVIITFIILAFFWFTNTSPQKIPGGVGFAKHISV